MMFYGEKEGTEKADDILFALQVVYGKPRHNYQYFKDLKLPRKEIKDALNYVKEKNINKFTYFEKTTMPLKTFNMLAKAIVDMDEEVIEKYTRELGLNLEVEEVEE